MKQKQNYYIRTAQLQTREEEGNKYIEGLIPYNSKSERMGNGFEIIAETAFSKTLKDKAQVVALFDHDTSKVLGSTKNETLVLESTKEGLLCTVKLGNTSFSNDAYELIQSRTVETMSFGFYPIKTEDKENTTIVKEAKLIEVSFCVAFPAYSETKSIAETRTIKIGEIEMTAEKIESLLNKQKEELTDEEIGEIQKIMELVKNKLEPEEEKTEETEAEKQPEEVQPEETTEEETTEEEKEEKRSLFKFKMEIARVL